MNHPSVLPQVEEHVRNMFATKVNKDLVYHNLDHTTEVVGHCDSLATAHALPEKDREILLVAAWFHDTGYLRASPRDHEEESKRIAREFLSGKVDESFMEEVDNCIDATKMPQTPTGLLGQILCDADLYHLGTDDFYARSMLLRDEVNNMNHDHRISKKDWRQMNIDFLERHRFFTDYAKENLEPIQEENIQMLVSGGYKKNSAHAGTEQVKKGQGPGMEKSAASPAAIEKAPVKNASVGIKSNGRAEDREAADVLISPMVSAMGNEVEEKKSKKKKKEKKSSKEDSKDKVIDLTTDQATQKKTDRGVVAMFRIMSENHVNLSQMADSKANIMISINTIVVSILVSVLLGKLQFYPQYIIPAILLITVCLGAIVFAILATRPNINEGKFSREDIQNKEVNLLFFGNFYNMDLSEYDWAMKEMMQDKEYLYGSMIKDIYFLGVVLARKYRLLRISYNIFMFGLVTSIIAFAIALFASTGS